MKIWLSEYRKRSCGSFLVFSMLTSLLLCSESRAEPKNTKTRKYFCKCQSTTLSKLSKKAECNMRAFNLRLSGDSATIEDFFHGKVDKKKKSKQNVIFYRGFEQLDFHYQFVLEVERKLLANGVGKAASHSGKAWLNVSGEKTFRETFNCG